MLDNASIQEKNLITSLSDAEKQIKECKNKLAKPKTAKQKTISRKNIEDVISALDTHYRITPSNERYDGKTNMDKLCWNERSCEVFVDEKMVQVPIAHKSVETYTNS